MLASPPTSFLLGLLLQGLGQRIQPGLLLSCLHRARQRGRGLEIQVLAGLAGALERLLGCRRSRRRLWRLVLLFRWSLCRLRLLIQLDPDAVSRRSWLVRPLQLDWRSVGLARLLGRLEHVAWGRRSARNLQVLPYRLLLLLLRLLA